MKITQPTMLKLIAQFKKRNYPLPIISYIKHEGDGKFRVTDLENELIFQIQSARLHPPFLIEIEKAKFLFETFRIEDGKFFTDSMEMVIPTDQKTLDEFPSRMDSAEGYTTGQTAFLEVNPRAKKAILDASIAASKDELRQAMMGILVTKRHIVGTNGHVLCFQEHGQEAFLTGYEKYQNWNNLSSFNVEDEDTWTGYIPQFIANSVKILPEDAACLFYDEIRKADVTTQTGENSKPVTYLEVSGDGSYDIEIRSRGYETRYPNFMAVIPREETDPKEIEKNPYAFGYAEINVESLQSAIKKINQALPRKDMPMVRLQFGSEIKLLCTDFDMEVSMSLPISGKHDLDPEMKYEMGFNRVYLMMMLDSREQQTVKIRYTIKKEDRSLCNTKAITCDNEYLVMPVKILQ